MALLKRYTKEHHDSIAASRRNLREATNRVSSETLVAQKPKAKAKAKPKVDEAEGE